MTKKPTLNLPSPQRQTGKSLKKIVENVKKGKPPTKSQKPQK